MPIATDFEIQADKDIRYIGAAHGASGAGYYNVIEFHRWLQDLADDAVASGDDYMDITRLTPSERSTDNIITLINGFNIDDIASEHLFDGSIIQTNGDVIYDGLLVYANAGMDMQVVQNGAIIVNDFWNTIPFGGSLKGLNANAANGISHRFMLKVRTAAADIDGRRLLTQTRVWGKTFSQFPINGTSRGNNVAALTYADDLNNQTVVGTIAGYNSIANLSEGYNGIDVDNNSVSEFYYSKWDRDTYTINQFYERMKWLTRQESASTIYGLNGELFRGITHQFAYDAEASGPFVQATPVTWGSGATAGTGQLLALLDSGTTGTMWIQLLTGVIPTDNMTINQAGGKTCLVNGTVTERTLSFPFCGVSTGSALIGAYGFALEATDLAATDKVFDLTNTQRTPPNYVTFTVGGLVSGEDYVLVGPESGGVLNEAQFTLNGALSGAAVTAVVVNGSIPLDTPSTGTIRILRANGVYTRHAYSAWSGSTFTITSTNFSTNGAANAANTYISYIDVLASSSTASFTSVYSSNRGLYIRVRDGGGSPIKTFETTGTLGSAGGSATAIRTSDT
jgi:hypothetical protein